MYKYVAPTIGLVYLLSKSLAFFSPSCYRLLTILLTSLTSSKKKKEKERRYSENLHVKILIISVPAIGSDGLSLNTLISKRNRQH